MSVLPSHILVVRFSALGDIAMTVPVLNCLLQQHSNLQVTVVSVPFVQPLFQGVNDRLHFFPADVKKEYSGTKGIWRLANKLKKEVAFDAVADLHNVLRTKLLRFFMLGYKKAAIDKGRAEKAALTRPHKKNLHQLTTTFQRYANVFKTLGYSINLDIETGHIPKPVPTAFTELPFSGKKLIGIAPFAKHHAKMYPADKMESVVKLLAQHNNVAIVLIGGKQDAALLNSWANKYEYVYCIAGKYSFTEELNIISALQVMVSMDSANMHLASLYGVPVVSIWGGTHPYLGFYGWGQNYNNALQEDLPCRPSSVFGNKSCPVHGESGCMQAITPEMVVNKLMQFI